MARIPLSVVDYVVCGVMLAASAAIGVFYACSGGKQRTTEEVFMGNRKMNVIPVIMSQTATGISAITLLGTPAEVYVNGTSYVIWCFAIFLCMPILAYVFVPMFYRLQSTSILEYLEMRFSKGVRFSTFIFCVLMRIIYSSIALYAPALALNVVTGLNIWASVLTVGAVCTFYTSLGGIKAVIWTDVLQLCVMLAGLVAVLVKGSMDQNGFGKVWELAGNGSRLIFFDFNPDPTARHTFWSLIVGGTFTALAIWAPSQELMQRMQCMPSLKKAQMVLWSTAPGVTGFIILSTMVGLVLYANYRDCDPINRKDILSPDQILPLYVMENLSFLTGLPGLFTACVFSGALSSVSSVLNSVAALVLIEVNKFMKNGLKGGQSALVGKLISLICGVVCIGLSFAAGQMGGILQAALALWGSVGGAVFGLFSLGMMFPHANYKGAYAGFFTSLALMIWITIGSRIYKPLPQYNLPRSIEGCPVNDNVTWWNGTTAFENVSMATTAVPEITQFTNETVRPAIATLYALSYQWYAMLASFTVIIVGMIVSFATGASKLEDIDPRLILPVVIPLYCCLSKEDKDLFTRKAKPDAVSCTEMEAFTKCSKERAILDVEVADSKLYVSDRALHEQVQESLLNKHHN